MEQTVTLGELMKQLAVANQQIEAFATGGEMSLDTLFALSGLLHFVGIGLGTLMVEYPDDARLAELMEMCTVLQAQTMQWADELAHIERNGASLH
ncbi:hypothetical protein VSR68_03340 [Paraburkholderia phymatum]|uniref:hypothetical protein n=1 Tax=Paraburkholderia phymatum TaxID=148447 RepID=UPI003176C470